MVDDPIDNSVRAWVIDGAAFLSTFTVFGVAYSFGVLLEPIEREFGSSRASLSLLFSIATFVYFLLGVVTGLIADRVGPRKVLFVGALVMSVGLLLTSRMTRLWIGYITYGLGVGVGVACGYVPMVAVVGGWFERRRGVALGIAVAGIGVGTVAAAPITSMLNNRYGWRTTYVIYAVASAAMLLACMVAVKAPPRRTGTRFRLSESVRTAEFRLIYIAGVIICLPLFQMFTFLVKFATDRGIPKLDASLLLSIVGGASVVGRLGLAALADRFGAIRMYKASFLIMGLSYGIWLTLQSYPWLVVFALAFGVGYGGFISLSPAVVAELFGVEALGGTLGAVYTSAAIGGLLGPFIGGLVIDLTGAYRWALRLGAVLARVSFVILLPLGRPREDRMPAGVREAAS